MHELSRAVQFDPNVFLSNAGPGRRLLVTAPHHPLFRQGEPADSVFYLRAGSAKLSVLSDSGREATLMLLVAGDFVGEETLNGTVEFRAATASAVTACSVLQIRREEMIRALHQEHALSDLFLKFLLARGGRVQADLIDHIFNCSEKRLVRTLLLLAGADGPSHLPVPLPRMTQEELANMIGTTRSRVSFFMNRFRRLGLITYKDLIYVHRIRLEMVLRQ